MHSNRTPRRRVRRAVVSALAAIAAVAAIGPAAAQATQHDTFANMYYGPGDFKFLAGQVSSEKPVCQKRTAFIHKWDGANWQPFDVFNTQKDGNFLRQIQNGDTNKTYRLVVNKKVINLPNGKRVVCRAVTSDNVFAG